MITGKDRAVSIREEISSGELPEYGGRLHQIIRNEVDTRRILICRGRFDIVVKFGDSPHKATEALRRMRDDESIEAADILISPMGRAAGTLTVSRQATVYEYRQRAFRKRHEFSRLHDTANFLITAWRGSDDLLGHERRGRSKDLEQDYRVARLLYPSSSAVEGIIPGEIWNQQMLVNAGFTREQPHGGWYSWCADTTVSPITAGYYVSKDVPGQQHATEC